MLTRLRVVSGISLLSVLCLAGPAQAQGLPSREEIMAKVKAVVPKVIEAAESKTIEIKGIAKIVYKAIPTNPKPYLKALGQDLSQQIPGVTAEQIEPFLGAYRSQITALLNEHLTDIGSFEALKLLKLKSKRIPVGKHRIGLVFNGDKPSAIRVFNADKKKMKKPVNIRLKTFKPKGVKTPQPLSMEIKAPKKQKVGKEKFVVHMAFLLFKAKSARFEVTKK